MTRKSTTFRLIALLLSLLLCLGSVPESAMAEGESNAKAEFVPENLLQTKIDMDNSAGIMFSHQNRSVTETTGQGIGNNGVVAGLVDGDTSTNHDIWAFSLADTRWLGVRYALTEAVYASNVVIYAGIPNAVDGEGNVTYNNDAYDIYAAETQEELIFTENLVAKDVICTGEPVTLPVNRKVKYIMLVYNAAAAQQTNARPKELQLWSGDESTAPEIVNHLRDTIKGDVAVLTEAAPLQMSSDTGVISAYPSNAGKLTQVITKDNTSHTDMYGPSGAYPVFQFSFLESVDISKIIIDAGLWNYDETYDVYASNDYDSLYAKTSRVAEAVACTYSRGAVVELDTSAKYVAVVVTSANKRIRRIKILGEKLSDNTFVSENLFQTRNVTTKGVNMYIESGNIEDSSKFDEKNVFATMLDGDTNQSVDIGTGLDWNPARYVGGVFSLDEAVYSSHLSLYAGYTTSVDTYRIYASDSYETLFTSAKMVADNVKCEGTEVVLPLNQSVRYVAIFCTGYQLYVCRPREIQLWSGDPSQAPEVFVSENVLLNKKSETEAKAILQYASGTVSYVSERSENTISDADFAVFTNGDTNDAADLNNTMSWDPPRYIGAEYTLDKPYFIGNINVYASIGEDYPETYSVYASDNLDTLYTAASCVAKSVRTTGNVISAKVQANVQYIAFVCESCTGNPRVREIEAWTADPSAVKPVTNELKVLTIGNSFAQDASWYSSEVAKANGKKLTFGYLYFPSCTLDKHYTAATENRAVFRFTVVNPDSKRTQIKNVSSDFNVSDPQNCATIEEALKYYDWDVVVFQQESSNARNYDTFANLGNLINYVKGYLPNARLMFHEVWRWGEWTDDQFALIKANAERACKEYQLEVIPTGLAFEYARTSMGSETAINDNDGHYQHASEYGKFVAGCCYASALFGIRIDKNTLDGHPSIDTSEGYSQMLVNAANCGAGYYYSYKDLDEDGKRGDGDLDQLRKYMTGAVEVSDDSLADYTGDEAVDVRDVVRLKKYLRYPADI